MIMALKKEIEIYSPLGTQMYAMRFLKGGELPQMLGGLFTSAKEAAKFRDLYYKSKLPKRKEK
jgi:hypothetical protein